MSDDTTPFRTLVESRYSCRAFRSEPVPSETIECLLDLARRAPSWCNTQPWHVTITSGAETEALRHGLGAWAQEHAPRPDLAFPERYEGVSQQRRRECAWQLYDSVGVAWGDREASARQSAENFRLFGAPHLAVITTERALGTYGAIDCGVFVAHFLLAATSLGIATIPQAAIAGCAPFIRSHFELPDDRQVVCGISFGYENEQHPANCFRTGRAAVSEIASWAGAALETTQNR